MNMCLQGHLYLISEGWKWLKYFFFFLAGLTLNHVHVVAEITGHHNTLSPFVYKGLYM